MHGPCLPEGKKLRQPHPCVLSSSWWATAAEQISSWSRACPTCAAPRNHCKWQPSGSLVSHEPLPFCAPQQLGPSTCCCWLSHVPAELCWPKAGAGVSRGSLLPSRSPACAAGGGGSLAGCLGASQVAAVVGAWPGQQGCWGNCAGEVGWPAGFVTGCVCLGLAGRHLRNGREEKLNTTIEGE